MVTDVAGVVLAMSFLATGGLAPIASVPVIIETG
jgi:hypothetical protein